MKTKILSTLVLLLTLMAVTSCKSYDKKDCEKLIEKIEDDDIDGKDHLSIVYQLDGLLSYDEDKLDEIDDMDSKSDRCDEFENFTDSDEFEYTCKMLYFIAGLDNDSQLSGNAKEEFKNTQIRARFKKLLKRCNKLDEKCK